MTYLAGQPIDDGDFNTLRNNIFEVYGDLHPGATTLPDVAFGYGQTSTALPPAAVPGQSIPASSWSGLFDAIANVQNHQVLSYTGDRPSYLPLTGPSPGNTVSVVGGATPLSTRIDTLRTNKLNASNTQTLVYASSSTSSWSQYVTFTFSLDFGSWDNLRYFFNTGSRVAFRMYIPTAAAGMETTWKNELDANDSIIMSALDTIGTQINEIPGNTGAYSLSNTIQPVFKKSLLGYYAPYSYITARAYIPSGPGGSGQLVIQFGCIDDEPTPAVKSNTIIAQALIWRAVGPCAVPVLPTYTPLGFAKV